MPEIAKVKQQKPYSSLKDLKRLRRIFRDKTKLLEEYASREFQEDGITQSLDMILNEQLSILDTVSRSRPSGLQEIMLKFDLWMEDYTNSDRMLSDSSEDLLFALYQDLKDHVPTV